jgi:hypothetical protein
VEELTENTKWRSLRREGSLPHKHEKIEKKMARDRQKAVAIKKQ